jgi:hypothetical protein
MLKPLKIKIIYPTNRTISEEEVDEELTELDLMRVKNDGLEYGYKYDWGYFFLDQDMIAQLNPKCVLKKGKTNITYYTEVVFVSGSIALAQGKPEDIYKLVDEYLNEDESV